jgi:hypothetical protein
MNGSVDWWGTTAFVAAISILLWLAARPLLPLAGAVLSPLESLSAETVRHVGNPW